MERRPSPIARFFGYAMIAVGALMALLSGACTLVFFTIGLQPKGDSGFVGMSLGLGLPFVGIGIALVIGGRALSRRRDAKEPPKR